MNWLVCVSYFFGGVFSVNVVPHFVAGAMGEPFQSPFAKPPGEGLSSSMVNILWAWFNLIVSYLLIVHVGEFDFHSFRDVGCVGAGAFLISLQHARHFGKFHGGAAKK